MGSGNEEVLAVQRGMRVAHLEAAGLRVDNWEPENFGMPTFECASCRCPSSVEFTEHIFKGAKGGCGSSAEERSLAFVRVRRVGQGAAHHFSSRAS